jgi:hypothetical protein
MKMKIIMSGKRESDPYGFEEGGREREREREREQFPKIKIPKRKFY